MKKERHDKDFIHRPTFPGGQKAMKEFVGKHLQYPTAAREAGVTGTVRLKITISHKGVVTEAKVVMSLGFGCDEEAARVAMLMRFNVPPNRKMRIVFHHHINIHFLQATEPAAQAEDPLDPQAPAEVQYYYTLTAAAVPAAKPSESTKPATGSGASYAYTLSLGPEADE